MLRNFREIILHPIVFFGAVFVASALTIGLIVWAINARQLQAGDSVSLVAITKIPAPSATPLPPATSVPSSGEESQTNPPISENGISVGSYVRIFNTGGAGLNLRDVANTNSSIRFVGVESEIFTVTEGPVDGDGFTWYYVVGFYDNSRTGWAVADYLMTTQAPD